MKIKQKSLYFHPIYIAKKMKVNFAISPPISEFNLGFFNSVYIILDP